MIENCLALQLPFQGHMKVWLFHKRIFCLQNFSAILSQYRCSQISGHQIFVCLFIIKLLVTIDIFFFFAGPLTSYCTKLGSEQKTYWISSLHFLVLINNNNTKHLCASLKFDFCFTNITVVMVFIHLRDGRKNTRTFYENIYFSYKTDYTAIQLPNSTWWINIHLISQTHGYTFRI